MAQCKDCIHCGLCKIYSDFIKNHDCELFVGKADVVPKSEVEALKHQLEMIIDEGEYWQGKYLNARLEVAREIFEKLDNYLWWFPQKGEYVLQEDLYDKLKEEYTESEGKE